MTRPPFRLAASTFAALMLTTSLTAPALAQPVFDGGPKTGFGAAPPPAPRPAPRPVAPLAPVPAGVSADELRIAADDPPIVVGRIARAAGTATLRLPGAEEWGPAGLNTAITEGTALWTEPGGRMALEMAQNRLFLDGGTALQVDELDEDGMRATLAGGGMFLRTVGMTEFGLLEVVTPEARFATALDGRYLIEAASPDGSRPGRIVVIEGAAEVTHAGDGTTPVALGPGEALILTPGAAPVPERWSGSTTPLMAWAFSLEPRRPVPQVARGMTGIAELSSIGRWDRSQEFGEVWYPPVQENWSPYTDGQWTWRDPWGWTWVDAQPWGFAPSHYGRWVQVGPRWAWAPEPVPVVDVRVRPAWAPALVAFFGGVAVGSALNARPVGWVPLAPREPYYPWYRASPSYVQRVNIRQVTNIVNVRNTWIDRGRDIRWEESWRRDRVFTPFYDRRLDGFRNARGAVQVPDRVFLSSLPVRQEARRLRWEDARQVQFAAGLPLRPAPETRGFTLRSAERLGYAVDEVRPRLLDRPRFAEPPERLRAALAADARRDAIERRQDAAQGRRQDAQEDRRRELLERQRDAAQDRRQDVQEDRRRELLERQRDAVQDRRQDAQEDRRRELIERQRDAAQDRRQDAQEDRARREVEDRRQRAEELRRRQEDIARRQAEAARGREETDRQRRVEELRDRQNDAAARRQQAEELRRQREGQARQEGDQARRQQDAVQRQQAEQARREQERAQRQGAEQAQRQQEQQQRAQAEQARREQERAQRQAAEQSQRQQMEQARRQGEQAQREQERAQRQQQEQAQRQQMEQMRRQQEQAQRQQMEQARRQQEQAQREQERAQRQQQEQAQRQQMEQMRRQQEQAQRQQMEQMRREQERAQRQQMEQAQRQAEQQARQQQEQARRQQEQAQRQQQEQAQRQAEAQARRQQREQERGR